MKRIGLLLLLVILASGSTLSQQKITWQKDGKEMALIPAGSFEMGDHFNEGSGSERPVHTVTLDAFYMDVHEVTVGQFREFVNQSEYNYNFWNDIAEYSPGDEYPMVYVNWNDATAYAKWAGKRLPTEAEWEYAARGGLAGKRYSWGDEIRHDNANYKGPGGRDKWDKSTAPVGSFESNGYGLYDMTGNVREWCADWYDQEYYKNSPAKNPQGPGTGEYPVLRVGGWSRDAYTLRLADRIAGEPNSRGTSYGFRCVSGSISPDSFTDLPDTPTDTETTSPLVNTIAFKSDATSLTADGKSTIALTINLNDAAGKPVSGENITLTADIGQISQATDNENGSYTATYTVGTKAGEATITATTSNGKSNTIKIHCFRWR